MARPKKTAARDDRHTVPLTGFRIPREVLDELDEYVERQNARAPRGFRTSRNAVVIELLRAGARSDLSPEERAAREAREKGASGSPQV